MQSPGSWLRFRPGLAGMDAFTIRTDLDYAAMLTVYGISQIGFPYTVSTPSKCSATLILYTAEIKATASIQFSPSEAAKNSKTVNGQDETR